MRRILIIIIVSVLAVWCTGCRTTSRMKVVTKVLPNGNHNGSTVEYEVEW